MYIKGYEEQIQQKACRAQKNSQRKDRNPIQTSQEYFQGRH